MATRKLVRLVRLCISTHTIDPQLGRDSVLDRCYGLAMVLVLVSYRYRYTDTTEFGVSPPFL